MVLAIRLFYTCHEENTIDVLQPYEQPLNRRKILLRRMETMRNYTKLCVR